MRCCLARRLIFINHRCFSKDVSHEDACSFATVLEINSLMGRGSIFAFYI